MLPKSKSTNEQGNASSNENVDYVYDEMGRLTDIVRTLASGDGRTQQKVLEERQYNGRSLLPSTVLTPSVNDQAQRRVETEFDDENRPIRITEFGYSVAHKTTVIKIPKLLIIQNGKNKA